jgi:hypothetical protein
MSNKNQPVPMLDYIVSAEFVKQKNRARRLYSMGEWKSILA